MGIGKIRIRRVAANSGLPFALCFASSQLICRLLTSGLFYLFIFSFFSGGPSSRDLCQKESFSRPFFASFSSLKFSGAQQFSGLLEKLTASK